MGIRFRRSIKIAPGLKVNINKKSIGITAGVRGAHASINTRGEVTKTAGIPGTGLSYVDRHEIGSESARGNKSDDVFEDDSPTPYHSTDSVEPPILMKVLRVVLIILSVILCGAGLLSFYPPADNLAGFICIFISVLLFTVSKKLKQR